MAIKSLWVIGATAICAGVVAAQYGLKEGVKAPDFSVKGVDDKAYSLKTLTEKKPLFLYFVKENCGANPVAVPLFKSLFKQYGDKANVVMVMNADTDAIKSWTKDHDLKITALPDSTKQIIKAYEMKVSQTVVQIDKDGKVVKVFRGFGKDSLEPLNAAMAAAFDTKPAQMSLSDVPAGPAYG